MPSPSLLHSVTCNFALPPLPERRRLLLIRLSHFKDGWSVTQKRGGGRGSKGGGGHGGGAMQYAKQGPGSQSQRAEMRCQRCTGALMYECGEIKRVTRQTGGGWKGESSVPRESSCTSASRCYLPSLLPSLHPSITLPFLSLLFLLSRSSYLFICLCFFISNSVLRLSFCATEEATALTRHSGHKERATEIKRRNAATHKILAYPRGIPTKLIPSEPNPSFSPSSLLIPPTSSPFFLSPRPLPRCYGVLFINMCKSLFLSTRGVSSTGPCHRLTPPIRFIA